MKSQHSSAKFTKCSTAKVMITIENESKFTPIQHFKAEILKISESFFHARVKTTIVPDPEDNSRLIITRGEMTLEDEEILNQMRGK